MNIESKLWKLIYLNDAYVKVLQKASGVYRTAARNVLPSDMVLTQMTERQFDKMCREVFHGAARY